MRPEQCIKTCWIQKGISDCIILCAERPVLIQQLLKAAGSLEMEDRDGQDCLISISQDLEVI